MDGKKLLANAGNLKLKDPKRGSKQRDIPQVCEAEHSIDQLKRMFG